jgi:hypothetical protein
VTRRVWQGRNWTGDTLGRTVWVRSKVETGRVTSDWYRFPARLAHVSRTQGSDLRIDMHMVWWTALDSESSCACAGHAVNALMEKSNR